MTIQGQNRKVNLNLFNRGKRDHHCGPGAHYCLTPILQTAAKERVYQSVERPLQPGKNCVEHLPVDRELS